MGCYITRKITLVAWDKVCIPKKYGDLNIKGCCKWNVVFVGKLLWQLARKKDILWVKWTNSIYMKVNETIWEHNHPGDCNWYWKKLNFLKAQMAGWYQSDKYMLTSTGEYSLSKSYQQMLGPFPRVREVDLMWSSVMLPKQRIIVWLACQNKLLTKERLARIMKHVDDQHCCLCFRHM